MNGILFITGGTGSFGSTMVRNLLSESVSEVRVFSRDETKQDQMRNEFHDERLRFFIGDARDQSSVEIAIKGADFEKSGGFPNFWGWGLEDNLMQKRVEAAGLVIDRSIFYPITDMVNILRPFDGYIKTVSNRDAAIFTWESPDTFADIKNLKYTIAQGTKFTKAFMVNISAFDTMFDSNDTEYISYDIRKYNNRMPIRSNYKRRVWSIRSILKNR